MNATANRDLIRVPITPAKGPNRGASQKHAFELMKAVLTIGRELDMVEAMQYCFIGEVASFIHGRDNAEFPVPDVSFV